MLVGIECQPSTFDSHISSINDHEFRKKVYVYNNQNTGVWCMSKGVSSSMLSGLSVLLSRSIGIQHTGCVVVSCFYFR